MNKTLYKEIVNIVTTLSEEISFRNALKLERNIKERASEVKNDNEAFYMMFAELYAQCQENTEELLIKTLTSVMGESREGESEHEEKI